MTFEYPIARWWSVWRLYDVADLAVNEGAVCDVSETGYTDSEVAKMTINIGSRWYSPKYDAVVVVRHVSEKTVHIATDTNMLMVYYIGDFIVCFDEIVEGDDHD